MTRKKIATSFLPFFAGVILAVLLLAIFSKTPASSIKDFLTGSFTSKYYGGAVFNTAVILIIAGLGASISLAAGQYNLGGEGQIYAGGFTAAIVLANTATLPAPLALIVAGIASAAVAAMLATISSLLRHFKNADVLLTSFITSSLIIPIIDGLIAGPARGATGTLLATPFIPEATRFLRIMPPSPLSADVFFVPVLCAAAWLFLYKTNSGRHLRILGTAPLFAEYCGYPRTRMMYAALAASGALHGIAGFVAVCGTYYTCHSGFYGGMGWNALSTALIAQSNPVALIPSGIVLSWLFTSSSRVALNQGFGFDINSLIQGVILFSLSIQEIRKFVRRKKQTDKEATTTSKRATDKNWEDASC